MNRVSAITREQLDRFTRPLDALADGLGQYLNNAAMGVGAGSQAEEERRGPFHRATTNAHTWGVLLLAVAVDHLRAYIRTVSEPLLSAAPWVAVRSIAEASATAAWLLDPDLSARNRAERAFAIRYRSLMGQEAYARANGRTEDILKVQDRLAQVTTDAGSLDILPRTNRNGKQVGLGEVMPSTTDLIRDQFGDQRIYRILSSVAHGTWALLQAAFEVPSVSQSDGVDPVEQGLRPDALAYLSSQSLLLIGRPFWYAARLLGWSTDKLATLLDSAAGQMGLNGACRTWTSASR